MNYDILLQLVAELQNKLFFLEDEILLMEKRAAPIEPNAVGSYVYRHWDNAGNCIYIGSGTGVRAWVEREHREEQYRVEIVVDGLSRSDAYAVESAFMDNYMSTHEGNTPKYNIAGPEEYFPAKTSLPGPWQLCYFNGTEPVASSEIFRSSVRSIVATHKSGMNNKISFSNGRWVDGLNPADYDSCRIRFVNH